MRVGVICNGSVADYSWLGMVLADCDKIICADGGTNHLYKLGVPPDLIVGDLDSILPEVMEYYAGQGVQLLRYPPEKDDTDQRLALRAAMELGATEVILLGAIGNRLDHTLGSLSVLAYLQENGVRGVVMDEYNKITLSRGEAVIRGEVGEQVSLLPLTTSVTGISTENLQYSLKDAVFELGNPYGISNVLTAPEAKVTFKEGLLLVIKSRDIR
jgi:thiamine pyrophosphokinase